MLEMFHSGANPSESEAQKSSKSFQNVSPRNFCRLQTVLPLQYLSLASWLVFMYWIVRSFVFRFGDIMIAMARPRRRPLKHLFFFLFQLLGFGVDFVRVWADACREHAFQGPSRYRSRASRQRNLSRHFQNHSRRN